MVDKGGALPLGQIGNLLSQKDFDHKLYLLNNFLAVHRS